MKIQLPNWIESVIIAIAVQALSAIVNYLQGGQAFTWAGLGAAVGAALLSYATSAGWAKYIPVDLFAQSVSALQPAAPPSQNTINITAPPSATATDTLPVTPAPDAAANADRLAQASNAAPVDAPVAMPEPPSSDVSAPVIDVPSDTVITPTAPPEAGPVTVVAHTPTLAAVMINGVAHVPAA